MQPRARQVIGTDLTRRLGRLSVDGRGPAVESGT